MACEIYANFYNISVEFLRKSATEVMFEPRFVKRIRPTPQSWLDVKRASVPSALHINAFVNGLIFTKFSIGEPWVKIFTARRYGVDICYGPVSDSPSVTMSTNACAIDYHGSMTSIFGQ